MIDQEKYNLLKEAEQQAQANMETPQKKKTVHCRGWLGRAVGECSDCPSFHFKKPNFAKKNKKNEHIA